MANKDEDKKDIEKAARAEARHEVAAKENEKKADFLEKANKKLAKAYDQALEQPNTVQLVAGISTALGAAGGAFALNRFARKKLREKGWVNPENKRSIGNIMVADGVPILVGTGMFIGGCFLKNGVASSLVCGLGGGLTGGTIISAATATPETP